MTPSHITFENWGLIPYQEALAKQLQYVEDVAEGRRADTVVFCTHPAVVTVGRGTLEGDVTDWSGEVVEVSRGGRATYHGPDQLVVYPILDLRTRGKDLHKHLRWIEDIVIRLLAEYGLDARREENATGVWVGDKKVCSIGIAVRKWISFHGLSLAADHSSEAYKGINPCGFSTDVMTSLETLLGRKVSRDELQVRLQNLLS